MLWIIEYQYAPGKYRNWTDIDAPYFDDYKRAMEYIKLTYLEDTWKDFRLVGYKKITTLDLNLK